MAKTKLPKSELIRHRDSVCMSWQALSAANFTGIANELLDSCDNLYKSLGSSVQVVEEDSSQHSEKACECDEGVIMGGYQNQTTVPRPHWMVVKNSESTKEFVSIDSCLLEEVVSLWMKGITTTGCCCGHNKINGYIGVADDDIERMLSLGYQVAPNPMDLERKDSFYPKSVKRVL